MITEPVRPRFGQLDRADGTTVPLVFQQTDDPTVFVGVHAGTEKPVPFNRGGVLTVDALGPGQAITLTMLEPLPPAILDWYYGGPTKRSDT